MPQAPTPIEGNGSNGILQSMPGITALITGLIVAYAVFYNWAYFSIIGQHFFRMFTLGDHVSSSLDRIPAIAVGAMIALVWVLFRSSKKQGEEVPANAIVIHRFESGTFYVGKPNLWHVLIGAAVVMLLLLLSPAPLWFMLYLPALEIWQVLSKRPLDFIHGTRLRRYSAIVYFVPIFCLFSVISGASTGVSDLRSSVGNGTLVLHGDVIREEVRILRAISIGVILREPQLQTIELVPWSQINRVVYTNVSTRRSLICSWLDWCFLDR